MSRFWQWVADYEWLLQRCASAVHLAHHAPTESDRWNTAVDAEKLGYQVQQFWEVRDSDHRLAYALYAMTQTPLPEHLIYLWED